MKIKFIIGSLVVSLIMLVHVPFVHADPSFSLDANSYSYAEEVVLEAFDESGGNRDDAVCGPDASGAPFFVKSIKLKQKSVVLFHGGAFPNIPTLAISSFRFACENFRGESMSVTTGGFNPYDGDDDQISCPGDRYITGIRLDVDGRDTAAEPYDEDRAFGGIKLECARIVDAGGYASVIDREETESFVPDNVVVDPGSTRTKLLSCDGNSVMAGVRFGKTESHNGMFHDPEDIISYLRLKCIDVELD